MAEIIFTQYPIVGIDVSQYNLKNKVPLDFNKAKEHGAKYVVIRSSYGIVKDSAFDSNWKGAKGILPRRAYHYLDYYSNHMAGYAVNGMSDEDWGKKQAQVMWNLIKDDNDNSIVWLDIEKSSFAPSIGSVLSRVITIAVAFMAEIDRLSGKMNGAYLAAGYVSTFSKSLGKRPLWVAWYNEKQTVETVLDYVRTSGWRGKVYDWQYASDGDIDGDGSSDGIKMGMGIPELDLNICFLTEEEFKASFNGSTIPETPPTTPETPINGLDKRITTASSGLRVRRSPSLSGAITDVMPKGTEVYIQKIVTTDIEWALIGYRQYCSKAYLK